jgi:hypothetical protein
MSATNTKMNSKSNNTSATKYCKVCQDAGKPESEYRSHFTRENKDPNSKVCCPTLLALECRYCFKAGHTIKYCKILQDNEKNKKRWEQEAKNKPVVTEKKQFSEKKTLTAINKFSYLDDEDSENELEEHIETQKQQFVVEEFPELCSKRVNVSFGGANYATALASKSVAPLPASIPVRLYPLNKKKVNVAELNWASMSSDEEDEEDEFEAVQDCYNSYDNKECVSGYSCDEDW